MNTLDIKKREAGSCLRDPCCRGNELVEIWDAAPDRGRNDCMETRGVEYT